MAHVKKYTGGAVGGVMAHDTRYENENVKARKNERIDPMATALNYELSVDGAGRIVSSGMTAHSAGWARHRMREKIAQAKKEHKAIAGREVKSNGIVAASWVITKPRDLDDSQELAFFETCYQFVSNRYGEENMLGCFVHKDETTPHVHVMILPRDKDGKLNARDVINRHDLKTFHSDLQAALDARGITCSVTLDDDDPKKAFSGLEQNQYAAAASKLDAKAAEIDAKALEIKKRTESLNERESALKSAENKLKAREEQLQRTEEVFNELRRRLYRRFPNEIQEFDSKDVVEVSRMSLDEIKTFTGNATHQEKARGLEM